MNTYENQMTRVRPFDSSEDRFEEGINPWLEKYTCKNKGKVIVSKCLTLFHVLVISTVHFIHLPLIWKFYRSVRYRIATFIFHHSLFRKQYHKTSCSDEITISNEGKHFSRYS